MILLQSEWIFAESTFMIAPFLHKYDVPKFLKDCIRKPLWVEPSRNFLAVQPPKRVPSSKDCGLGAESKIRRNVIWYCKEGSTARNMTINHAKIRMTL